jgi:NAD-dependent SIR2 family protein deacetylase
MSDENKEFKHVAQRRNPRIGRQAGRGTSYIGGKVAYCVCPECGMRTPRKMNIEPSSVKCPKCRTPMAPA